MTITTQTVKKFLHSPTETFNWFQRLFAVFFVFIPLILKYADKEVDGTLKPGFRDSISDYVYMIHNYVFGMLLAMAAMLFIFNGALYFRQEQNSSFDLERSGKWYNIGLGLALIGVIIFPHTEFKYSHYTFAALFFLGNAVVIAFFHTKRDRIKNIILAILAVLALGLNLLGVFPWLTLFWAEWVSVAAVAVHFVLEAKQ